MNKYKINFKREECLGCGACTSCDNWVLSDDGKASPIKSELEEVGCNETAAQVCPINIIKIEKI